MGTNNVIFLEVLEWFDQTGTEVSHRLPEIGSGEIKLGAQVIVRDNQAAVFYTNGVACDAIGPGRHTLKTMNIPLLTKLLSLPWAFTSPIRAEVYFVNLKVFNNLKWGTRDPVAFRDKEFGLVRLRAHGICNIQVSQPVLFVNTLVGTQASYGIDDLENYLSEVIVSRLNDHLGEHLKSLLDFPSQYEKLAGGLSERLTKDLAHYGLALKDLYLNAITPPAEVQQAIDDRSRLEILGKDLHGLMQMKAAMALEKAAEGEGLAQGGIGMGLGLMIPGLLTGLQTRPGATQPQDAGQEFCPECGLSVEAKARFCPHCGHQILVLRQCGICGKNLSPKAKFCPACGAPAGQTHAPKICKECGSKNRPEAVYCNECGGEL
ncbi:MAG: SPFH domain-containing protein [Deltaproteobacteria bacterium]|nr:SPFH domain-containing protein [Deltaproteobacteria bacterium]MBW1938291.1 SPFH domain-containing protein [Deltaproteobacteria bacterium]